MEEQCRSRGVHLREAVEPPAPHERGVKVGAVEEEICQGAVAVDGVALHVVLPAHRDLSRLLTARLRE